MSTKVDRVTFEGEGADEIMSLNYPAISKVLAVPIGSLFETLERQFARHGAKQRFGDFRAQDKDLTDREKDQIAYDRAVAYLEHLQAGGDWKMSGERDTTGAVIEALVRLGHDREMVEKAAVIRPEQVKVWRGKAKVKHMMAKINAERLAKLAKDAKDEEIEIEVE